jgi:maltose alpha-D-glucosyltransferase/alpha-amylase
VDPQWYEDITWSRILGSNAEDRLARVLAEHVKRARWFGGKGRRLRRLRIADSLTVPTEDQPIYMLQLEATYANAPKDSYVLALGFASHDLQVRIAREAPESIIAQVVMKDGEGILYDAIANSDFRQMLLDLIARRCNKKMGRGRLVARRGSRFAQMLGDSGLDVTSRVLKAEQSNTSVIYDSTFFLKLYRRIEEGVNPDVELSRHLTEQTNFANLPAFAGSLQWHRERAEPMTIALLLQQVPNESDGWSYTLDNVERSYGYALTVKGKLAEMSEQPVSIFQVATDALPPMVCDFIGPVYLEMVALLGRRTAQLHRALASLSTGPEVTPEPFSLLYQKALYQSIRALTLKVFGELEHNRGTLGEEASPAVEAVLNQKKVILGRLRHITDRKIRAMKIRTHGDYHLGQVLYTGKDFVIIDFEGEPARSITERRLKQSALRDVAGMIRSFHYAAQRTIRLRITRQGSDVDYLQPWADLWYTYVSGVFLNAYRQEVAGAEFVPADEKDFATLLRTFLIEKAVYEMGYELNNRPNWLMIPVRGIEKTLKA